MALGEFHHFGVPTTVKSENEIFIEGAGVYITDSESHPFNVEFLRFLPDSPMHEAVKKSPHAAFIVKDLDAALVGRNVIIPPFDATESLRCAFIMDGDAVLEIMMRR